MQGQAKPDWENCKERPLRAGEPLIPGGISLETSYTVRQTDKSWGRQLHARYESKEGATYVHCGSWEGPAVEHRPQLGPEVQRPGGPCGPKYLCEMKDLCSW